MSVAYDSTGGGDKDAGGGGKSPYSWTHTPVGTLTGVVVGFYSVLSDFGQAVTGVTYGGNAMSLLVTQGDGNVGKATLWWLANPPSGAQTVTVTLAGAGYGGCNSIGVTGGDTSTVLSATGSAVGSSAAPSSGVTSATTEVVGDFVGQDNASGAMSSAGGSQTIRYNQLAISNAVLAMSTQPGASGTVTSSWTSASSGRWASISFSFKDGAGGGSSKAGYSKATTMIGGVF